MWASGSNNSPNIANITESLEFRLVDHPFVRKAIKKIITAIIIISVEPILKS